MPASAVNFRVNQREFTATLRRYSLVSRRTPAEICNRKAYFINRRAIWHTHKADYAKMARELGQVLKPSTRTRKTPTSTMLTMARGKYFNTALTAAAPLLALIINARRGRKGLPGLYGPAMKKAFQRVFGARARSIAFLKSGWIEARDTFKNWCLAHGVPIGGRGLPPSEGSGRGGPKQIGGKKLGGATMANGSGWRARARFWNSADAKQDHRGALIKYGTPALQRAFDEETADTIAEIEKRLKQHALACGIRTA